MNQRSACESCGQEFSCGATLEGCWCSEVTLADEALEYLQKQFDSCLCRACLEKVSRGFDEVKVRVPVQDRDRET